MEDTGSIKSVDNELKDIFNKALNSHGYPFQQAVIHAAKEAHSCGKSRWIFEASEFPTGVNNKNTRIDFILKYGEYFLIAECKRVNPAYGSWCFARVPIIRRNQSTDQFTIEYLRRCRPEEALKVLTHCEIITVDNYYHIGIAIKNNKIKGDSGNSGRDAIEKTASQVCLGVNGLIQLALKTKDLVMFNKGFIPVIFTTAKLWATDSDLSTATLADGTIDLSCSNFEEKPWVLYQYHLTPEIKHSVESHQSSENLADILWFAYSRTIPIVNGSHVGDFLSWLNPRDFFD